MLEEHADLTKETWMPLVRTMIGAMVVACAGAAQADVVSLTPGKDNTLYQTPPTSDASNGQGTSLFVGVTGGASIRRGLVAFDLSSIPAGSTITSVSLNLFLNRTSALSENVALHKVLADWGEGASNAGEPGGLGTTPAPGDATWNFRFYNTTLWTTPGGDFVSGASASTPVSAPLNVYTWGSTTQMVADVQGWLNQPGTNFGWVIRGDETGLSNAMRFDSREGANRPTLSITFTPPAHCGTADFNCDGDVGTDADIEAFFQCLAGTCPQPPCTNTSADFNGDGDVGTDADIEAFFRVLAGGPC
jgi:hypothetical protein